MRLTICKHAEELSRDLKEAIAQSKDPIEIHRLTEINCECKWILKNYKEETK